jgi:hypothetical protein
MKRRFKNDAEAIAALRQEPEFRALVEDLRSMSDEGQDRLQDHLSEQIRKEECNGCEDEDL